jgi:hypothetical protein
LDIRPIPSLEWPLLGHGHGTSHRVDRPVSALHVIPVTLGPLPPVEPANSICPVELHGYSASLLVCVTRQRQVSKKVSRLDVVPRLLDF